MIHPNLLFLSSGSWEVGSLGCENIGRDQISPKFLESEQLYSAGTPLYLEPQTLTEGIAMGRSTCASCAGLCVYVGVYV